MGSFAFGPDVAPFDHGSGVLKRGQIVEIVTPGAGGYGPPSARDPAAVTRDIAERRLTAAAAQAIYGGV